MLWTTSFFSLLLSITAAGALPSNLPADASLYSSLLENAPDDLQLINCPLGDSVYFPESTLPAPSKGLELKFVTVGRGTQNYTCPANNNTAKPKAIGATANLFDASCIAALHLDSDSGKQFPIHIIPDVLKPIAMGTVDFLADMLSRTRGQDMEIGKHYFTADGVPFFDLRSQHSSNDWLSCQKEAEMPAPERPGNGVNEDVAWLKLKHVDGGLSEVYRLHTAGGSPPATCEGISGEFTMEYAAEYWFYG
ncbi:hypothetical protein ASPVEDRAFT_25610 [Aspergillus versicolor CBS 583.65]|uniref:Malate dehydrogenase n=1 Tax=Aspergillus versicolor CBS 583.65 TaxID=1036611 RepID=A0A1L9PB51_ASPVE|nr:uncharacterized protein ASPVEDRAFT_25610 [Aspergillus versicolor CBS 583.65]OJI98759.1 hypothetical protein ASPVEDRAFT_25610 [Aspergillus versicolor CBS 583.65]